MTQIDNVVPDFQIQIDLIRCDHDKHFSFSQNVNRGLYSIMIQAVHPDFEGWVDDVVEEVWGDTD